MAFNPAQTPTPAGFRGLITNADPHDIGAGAAVIQTNLQCKRSGQLQCRKGLRPGGFANSVPPEASPVLSAVWYSRPEADWVIYHLASGDVKTGRSFS